MQYLARRKKALRKARRNPGIWRTVQRDQSRHIPPTQRAKAHVAPRKPDRIKVCACARCDPPHQPCRIRDKTKFFVESSSRRIVCAQEHALSAARVKPFEQGRTGL